MDGMTDFETQYIFPQAVVGGSKKKKENVQIKTFCQKHYHRQRHWDAIVSFSYTNVRHCYNCQMNPILSQLLLF